MSPVLPILFCLMLFSAFSGSAQPGEAQSPADILWQDACSLLDKGRYQDARNKFDEFIWRCFSDPRVPEARVRTGICDYRHGGRTPRALEAWSRTVNAEILRKRVSPALLLGLEQLAAHYRARQQAADWQKAIERLFENFPEDPVTIRETELFARHCLVNEAWMQAVSVYERIEPHLSNRDRENLMRARAMGETGACAGVILKAANSQLEQDSVSLAARLYEEALKRDPSENEKHEAMTKLGWCLYLQHKLTEAEGLWQRVIKEGQSGSEWVARSRWHIIQLMTGPLNRTDKAIELCDVQTAEFRSSFRGRQASFVKAWIYWLEKDWEKAYRSFMELISAYPDTAQHDPIQKYIRECEEGMAKSR